MKDVVLLLRTYAPFPPMDRLKLSVILYNRLDPLSIMPIKLIWALILGGSDVVAKVCEDRVNFFFAIPVREQVPGPVNTSGPHNVNLPRSCGSVHHLRFKSRSPFHPVSQCPLLLD